MSRPNHYRQILNVLESLHKAHPTHNMGKHISTALDGHDVWGISDRNFLQALKDYQVELESDVADQDLDKIIQQGLNLNNILEDEEED